MQLDALFSPKNVAIIGASHQADKVGHHLVKNLLDAGFKGEIYPVNSKGGEILGLPVITDADDLPTPLDMAILAIPASKVLSTVKTLVEHRLRAAVVVAAGFKESGNQGWREEKDLARICRDNDIALVGPGSLGVISTPLKLNVSCASSIPKAGNIAFFSRSGSLCSAILDWAQEHDIGFSQFVSLGDKALVNESHMLYTLSHDPDTKVVLAYVESIENGEAFMRMARKITRDKPVIVLKAGSTAAGAKAVSAHTGILSGDDKAYSAAFLQTGILRVGEMAEMFDLARAFSTQPLPKGPAVAIVTNAGGPGLLAVDATDSTALTMASFGTETVDKLKKALPANASLYNPVDVLGDADSNRLGQAVSLALEDQRVDALLVVLAPSAAAPEADLAKAVTQAAKDTPKPVLCCLMGGKRMDPARAVFARADIPCYAFPEPAVKSLDALYRYSQWKSRPSPVMASVEGRRDVVRRIVKDARAKGVAEIEEDLAREVLGAYDIHTARTVLARSSEEAVAAAADLGYPVVCKVASPQIKHKADAGGVRVNIKTPDELRQAFKELTGKVRVSRPDNRISGCLIQSQAPANAMEVMLGFRRDDQFGPLLRFGLSGIFVDVLKDVSYRLAPVSMNDARQLVRDVKTSMLLKGFEGGPAVHVESLEDIAIRLSQLSVDFPEIYEAELSPVLVNDELAVVAGVRMTLLPL